VTIRLNKLLATRGIGARRKCNALIESGVVRVNGEVVTAPGARITPERDRVTVSGRPIPERLKHRYLLLHKPVGTITTLHDPEGRPTILDLLPREVRLYPVGRLDADTSGLLIVTNDGDLAHHLMHPRYGLTKHYRVLVAEPPSDAQLERLERGVEYEPGVVSAPAQVRRRNPIGRGSVFEISIQEGRYRQVRRMCEAVGLAVMGLHRWAYGPLRLGELERGMYRELSEAEVSALRAASSRVKPRPAVTRRGIVGKDRALVRGRRERVRSAGVPHDDRAMRGARAERGAPRAARSGAPGRAGSRPMRGEGAAPRGGFRPPPRGRSGPPASARFGAPSRERSGPPDRARFGAPSRERFGPPARARFGASSRERSGPPARARFGAPARERSGPPARARFGASSRERSGSPGRSRFGAPSRERSGPPARARFGGPPRERSGATSRARSARTSTPRGPAARPERRPSPPFARGERQGQSPRRSGRAGSGPPGRGRPTGQSARPGGPRGPRPNPPDRRRTR